jgi:hypothetical protein
MEFSAGTSGKRNEADVQDDPDSAGWSRCSTDRRVRWWWSGERSAEFQQSADTKSYTRPYTGPYTYTNAYTYTYTYTYTRTNTGSFNEQARRSRVDSQRRTQRISARADFIAEPGEFPSLHRRHVFQ